MDRADDKIPVAETDILTELGSILETAIALGAKAPAWLGNILETTLTAVNDLGDNTQQK